MIELPDFVTPELIERTYRRAMAIQDAGHVRSTSSWWSRHRARHLRHVGTKMAMARDPKLLLFLEKAAEHLRRMNDAQKSEITDRGFARTDFSEFELFRTAYEKAMEPKRDEAALFTIWGWVYASAAEALNY
jgi:hypothetical protein